jgi:hypothetical protein
MRRRQPFGTTASALFIAGLAFAGAGPAAAAEEPTKLTKAKAEAKAEAALPATADVGADFAEAPQIGPSVAQVTAGLPGCKQIAKTFPGGTNRGIGGASRSFNRAVDTVFVDISLFRDASSAKKFMKSARSDTAVECEKRFFVSTLESAFPGAEASVVAGDPLPVSPPGVDDVIARGGSLQVSGGFSQPVHTVELRDGRAVSTMVFASSLAPDEMSRIATFVAARLAGL